MPKDLRLPLKKQWFEMTKAGIKTEDYREITPYWAKRLAGVWSWKGVKNGLFPSIESTFMSDFNIVSFKPFATTTLTLGYPSATDTDKLITFEHLGIEIGYGKQEWGAEPNKLYFIIKHGKLL